MINKLMVVAVIIVIVAVFYAYNLQLRVDNLEATIDALGNPKIVEFVASIGSANYVVTEQGQDYGSGSFFTKTDYNDQLVSTPTIIFDCKYARVGSYAGIDPELERLDLKNKTCLLRDCELTADEKQQLNDKLIKLSTSDRVAFFELEYGGCYNKTEVYCSPTSDYCKEQQPILGQTFKELGVPWEMICTPSSSIDYALCNMLLSFEAVEKVTFIEVMESNPNLNFCEVSVALDQIELFNLVEKVSTTQ